MCFSVPLKILKLNGAKAQVEGGSIILLDNEFAVKPGDYIQITGNIAVRKISPAAAKKIRATIFRLNKPYAENDK